MCKGVQRPNIESVGLRITHSIIYLVFAYYALKYNTDYCWKILVADLVFGTCVYVISNMIPNNTLPILPK